LGLLHYRYKNDKYSEDEKLFGAYFKDACSHGIAFSADDFRDYIKRNKELA
jgi:hypothetical protein